MFFMVLCTGCRSVEMSDYIITGQPDECNDYYITLAVYYKNGGKDFAFPATIYEKCTQARAREQKIKDLCAEKCKGDLKAYQECVK